MTLTYFNTTQYIYTQIFHLKSSPSSLFSIMARHISFLLISIFFFSSTISAYNVIDFGAKPNGRIDSSAAFLRTWVAACRSKKPATIWVPAGRFYISQVLFKGPCNNNLIRIYIKGTIIAPARFGFSTTTSRIMFKYVNGVYIYGGTLNGRGHSFWACKLANRGCSEGATSLTIAESKNVLVSGMTLLNSHGIHMGIFGSKDVTVRGVKIIASAKSPNTDGIHVQMSRGVTITGSIFKTGDDCISMGEGTSNVWIENVACGPGHGISIGSLGATPSEVGVSNIIVKSAVFTGTENGLRIKTWAKPNTGFVNGVRFEDIVMKNVQNPIYIDQNYCPDKHNCPRQSSGIKISQVKFINVQGTSATPVAVKLDCSRSNPCRGIQLQHVKLFHRNKPAKSYCKHVHGTAIGFVLPRGRGGRQGRRHHCF